ncbi:MAG: helix-turn-helix transcriptional regulator [Clostridia bacterium]|nr:helix-turn-helix transcriptional regulator [Clostridia bacterium]MCI1959099.1 helix-turn-helix transcriptional regulator [Clostridia bacterium]MCI2000864.1 helix-turn-helix transcriptional regulator [Clostridia bacterium]MCI2015344.1 helix-turn-helix transcriptional regulator [Clostridia bacterium]
MLANIKAEMARRNLTVKEVSKEIGISTNTFRFKLNEKREFTLSELAKLALLFDKSIDYLIEIRNDNGNSEQNNKVS